MITDYGKVAASSPIDRVARNVASAGFHFELSGKDENAVRSREPFETRAWPKFSCPADDLTGRVFGRFTVIGLGCLRATGKGAAWVVRCQCGWYQYRRTASLKKMALERAMCDACDRLEQLKKGLA